MPHPSEAGRARARALTAAALAASAAACAIVAGPASAASADAFRLQRSLVSLDIAKGRLDPWSPIVGVPAGEISFSRTPGLGRVLTFTDDPHRGDYVAVTTTIAPQTIVTQTAQINLYKQHLRRGKVRSLMSVTGRDGTSFQAGVMRTLQNQLMWAVWTKTPSGKLVGIRTGHYARLREWHTMRLTTTWGGPRSRASLWVDKRIEARTPRRALQSTAGERAIVGLGRPSKRSETGILVVRSVTVSGAAPLAGLGGTPTPAPVSAPAQRAPDVLPGTQLKVADYETGDLSQWGSFQRVASDRIQITASPVRQGRYAARFEVRNGDNPIGYGDRAEVQTSTGETEGAERWYAWSTMLAPDFPRSSAWQVISQWHANADGSPPIGFFVEGDDLALQVHRTASPGHVLSVVDIWRGPLLRGRWRDIRMHVRWSGSDRRGWVELWIDGRRQRFDDGSTRRYIRTMFPGIGNYFTMGLYRQSGLARTGVVYHDAFRMSSG